MPAAADRLSATFSALADPTRRAILARLALGETSVTELAEPFEMSLPAVSKHLKVLERAGLIARGREAQMAAVPHRGRRAARRRRLARALSPALGGAARSPGGLPEGDCRPKETPASQGTSVAARNSLDLEPDPRSIIGTRVLRRAARAGVRRRGPIPSTWRNGGVRTASPPRPARSNFAPAACGASSCTARTAATTRTASPSTRS